MKRIALILALALSLSACTALQKLQTAYSIVTEATVTPTQVVVAANAFDGLEGTATQYLVYCKANLTTAICSADTRRKVIKAVRIGRAARTQLEASIASGGNGPSPIYNTLVTAINELNTTPAITGAPK